jgi:hypothetical protein
MIEQLQYWNTALKNCFERPEIPSDESDPMVQDLIARFNPKICDKTRACAAAAHAILKAGWKCATVHNHRTQLVLDWQNKLQQMPTSFDLTISFLKTGAHANNNDHHGWRNVTVEIKEVEFQTVPAQTLPVPPNAVHQAKPSQADKTLFGVLSSKKNSSSLSRNRVGTSKTKLAFKKSIMLHLMPTKSSQVHPAPSMRKSK